MLLKIALKFISLGSKDMKNENEFQIYTGLSLQRILPNIE